MYTKTVKNVLVSGMDDIAISTCVCLVFRSVILSLLDS